MGLKNLVKRPFFGEGNPKTTLGNQLSRVMEEGGIGTTPTQVLTPRGFHVATPHNANERVELAAGRVYLRPSRPTGRDEANGDDADGPPEAQDPGGRWHGGEVLPSMSTARLRDPATGQEGSARERSPTHPVVRALLLPGSEPRPVPPPPVLGRPQVEVEAAPAGMPPSPASSSSSSDFHFDLGHLELPNRRPMCPSCGTRPAEDWLGYSECSECFSEH